MENEVELCVEVGSNIGDTWVENADINQLCRSCANTHDNMIPIFEGDGLEHDLQNKIDKHFPVNISRDDGLPHQMCYQCASTLVAWHDMYMGCIDAENKLKNLLKKSTAKGQVEKTVAGSSIASAVSASVEPDSQQKMASEMEVDNDDNDDDDDDDDVPEHGGDDNDDEEDDDDDNDDEDEEVEEIVLHKLEAKAKEKNVEVNEKGTTIRDQSITTNYEAKRSTLMEVQILSQAHKDGDFDLLIYDYEVNGSDKVTKVRNAKYFFCNDCGKGFTMKSNLVIHGRTHTGERPFKCKCCGKQFTSRMGLIRHARVVHEGVKNFVCDECNKRFSNQANLNYHKLCHTGERPYQCKFCERTFNDPSNARRHIKLHMGIKNFVCDVCNNRFANRTSLNDHMARHSENRPHVCKRCGATFKTRSSLYSHKLSHATPSHMCDQCGLSFKFRHLLNQHIAKHSNECATPSLTHATPSHMCDQCGRNFKRKDHLTQHLNKSKCRRNKQLKSTEIEGSKPI